MEPNPSQKPANVATNMPTSKVPAEIGNNADAAFPLAGAGAGDSSFAGPFTLEDEASDAFGDGAACGGETFPARKIQ